MSKNALQNCYTMFCKSSEILFKNNIHLLIRFLSEKKIFITAFSIKGMLLLKSHVTLIFTLCTKMLHNYETVSIARITILNIPRIFLFIPEKNVTQSEYCKIQKYTPYISCYITCHFVSFINA